MKRKGRSRGKPGPQRMRFLTAKQVQDELGISERTFQRMVQAGLTAAVPGKGSKPALYDKATVATWGAKREADDDLTGGDGETSVWLEKYREERWREAKRKNDLEERLLLRAEDVRRALAELAGALRAELVAIEQIHGRAVGEAIRGMVDRAEAGWRERLKMSDEPKPEETLPEEGAA